MVKTFQVIRDTRKYVPYIIPFLLLAWPGGDRTVDQLTFQRYTALLVLAIIYGFRDMTLQWALISSVITAFWYNLHAHEPFEQQLAVHQSAAMAGLTLLLGWLFVATISARGLMMLERGFGFAGALMSTTIVATAMHGQFTRVPFLDNPSTAASFVVVCSFMLPNVRPFRQILPLLTILLLITVWTTGASTPWLALVAGTVAYHGGHLIRAREKYPHAFRFFKSVWGFIFLFACGALLFAIVPKHMWDPNGRVQIWDWALSDWWASGWWVRLCGNGLGTFKVLFPLIQAEHIGGRPPGGWFLVAHNDYIQVLFELGLTGFILFLTSIVIILRRAMPHPRLYAAAFSYAAVMCTNFPLHVPAFALLGLVIAATAMRANGR